MASLWRKTNGMWYVSYRENGKQRARSLRTKDKREALRLKRAIELNLDACQSVFLKVTDKPSEATKNPTLDEFWKEFHGWACDNRSPSTIEEYKNWFTQISEFTGARRLGDIKSSEIHAFRSAISKQGKRKARGNGVAKSSVNSAIKTLHAIWNHAIKLGLYTGENPISGIEKHKIPQSSDREYLDGEQIERLLEVARTHGEDKYVKRIEAQNVYLAIALMALAGLRKREASFARWDWIDWKDRVIMVDNDEHFTTKNKRSRVISMNAQLIRILEPYKKVDGYVLESLRANNGKTDYRVDFKMGFKTICDKAGIEATPHDLRHSFASRHAVAGTSFHVIAGWLGHSTVWVTQRYAHFQNTYNKAADNI